MINIPNCLNLNVCVMTTTTRHAISSIPRQHTSETTQQRERFTTISPLFNQPSKILLNDHHVLTVLTVAQTDATVAVRHQNADRQLERGALSAAIAHRRLSGAPQQRPLDSRPQRATDRLLS